MTSQLNFLDAFGYYPNLKPFVENRDSDLLSATQFTSKRVFFQYVPLFSNLNGIKRTMVGIEALKANVVPISFSVGHIVRGIGEVLFLGTVLFWLIDLIVTLGRMLQVKCADRSESSMALNYLKGIKNDIKT